jgi:formate-dependent nitrite reductase membrane component NrfD
LPNQEDLTVAEDLRDVPYEAEWVQHLQHRSDPNRVSNLQMPGAGNASAPGAAFQRPPLSAPEVRAHDPQSTPAEPSYYDISMLKQPVWKWEIAVYFYLGGLSAGAYILGRLASRSGHRDLSRTATYLAMAALLPCPVLLIHDLGDPKRFHHMLRVLKTGSPMSVGTWTIMGYSGVATYEVARQFLNDYGSLSLPAKLMNNVIILAALDMAGIPFALMLAGYTGVLLSCTSNPLWCKNPWLGPLFSASAIATGAEAVGLAMNVFGSEDPRDRSQEVLKNLDTVAHAAELACLKGFNQHAGEKAAPLHKGKLAKHHMISVGCILAAEVLKRIPVEDRYRKPVRIATSLLGLAAGFSLRWSMVMGGHDAAADPHIARMISQAKPDGKAR